MKIIVTGIKSPEELDQFITILEAGFRVSFNGSIPEWKGKLTTEFNERESIINVETDISPLQFKLGFKGSFGPLLRTVYRMNIFPTTITLKDSGFDIREQMVMDVVTVLDTHLLSYDDMVKYIIDDNVLHVEKENHLFTFPVSNKNLDYTFSKGQIRYTWDDIVRDVDLIEVYKDSYKENLEKFNTASKRYLILSISK